MSKKFSDFPAAAPLTGGETAAGLQAGANVQLPLGTAAAHADTDFATAAQGAKADSAVQPGDIGTAAAHAASDFDAAGAAAAAQAAAIAHADAGDAALVPSTRTVNGHALSADVVVTAADVGAPSGSGTSTGTNTGDQTSVTGNAGTATALATARTIDGQSFDGTANITVVAPATHAAGAKSPPVDADELPLVDSSASWGLAKLTWANLKAALKTYTDTLYATLNPAGQTITSASTVTPTGSNDYIDVTALAASVTIANPSATPAHRHTLVLYVRDNGTACTITWGSQYRGIGGSLPSTTVAGKRMYFTAVWNNGDSKYDVILPVAQES